MRGRFFVADGDHFVEDLAIEHCGNETRADSLDLMIARLATGDHWGCCGFDGADAHPFHFLFEYFSNSGNGAASAHSGDECSDAFDLLKQLDSSGLSVHF